MVEGLPKGAVDMFRPFMAANLELSVRSVLILSNSRWLMEGRGSLGEDN
jgi:hypothetical protein